MSTSHSTWNVFMRRAIHSLIVSALGIALVSCSSAPPKDWVAAEWDKAMDAYHIFPVYPPNEDVHVGDIYGGTNDIYENDADWEKASTAYGARLDKAIKLDAVSMAEELNNYYTSFPVFPDTPEAPIDGKIWTQQDARAATHKSSDVTTNKTSKAVEKDTTKSSAKKKTGPSPKAKTADDGALQSVFTPTKMLTKLPLVALPGFTIARSSSASGGASVPLRFFKLLGSASSQKDLAISLNIRTAEVYGVPAIPAYKKLVGYCKATPGACTPQFVGSMLDQQTGHFPQSTQIFIINRVYMTRSIEYTYDSDSMFGAQGKALVDLQSALDNQKALIDELGSVKKTLDSSASDTPKNEKTVASAKNKKQSLDKTDSTTSETRADTQLTEARAKLQTLLDRLSKSNADLEGSPVPGATFTIGSVRENGISIVQTFERPVVIGYRAIRLQTQPLISVNTDQNAGKH